MKTNHHWRVTFSQFKQVLGVEAHDRRRAKEQAMKALRDRGLIPAPQTYDEAKAITGMAHASRVRNSEAMPGKPHTNQ
jgi:hypothetical protein